MNKQQLAQQFGVTQRSIQRDMESLRCFLAEQHSPYDVVYDRQAQGYRLQQDETMLLSNSEVLAACKILLESRSMCKSEMFPILNKMIANCVPEENRKAVEQMLANEKFHYIEPHHNKPILEGLWEIGQAVQNHQIIEIEYLRMKEPKLVKRRVQPVGIMFSEYYFYLTAFQENKEHLRYVDVANCYEQGGLKFDKAIFKNPAIDMDVFHKLIDALSSIQGKYQDVNDTKRDGSITRRIAQNIHAKPLPKYSSQQRDNIQEICRLLLRNSDSMLNSSNLEKSAKWGNLKAVFYYSSNTTQCVIDGIVTSGPLKIGDNCTVDGSGLYEIGKIGYENATLSQADVGKRTQFTLRKMC